jgi:hypothetical protein
MHSMVASSTPFPRINDDMRPANESINANNSALPLPRANNAIANRHDSKNSQERISKRGTRRNALCRNGHVDVRPSTFVS